MQKRWKSLGLTDAEILTKENEFDLLFKEYPDGVSFNKKGFPEFSKYRHKDVPFDVDIGKLNPNPVNGVGSTGSQLDMRAARDAMRKITGNPKWTKPKDYTWHHIENTTKLELVPTDLHSAVRHSGGRSTYKF